ncbi:MAG: prepilin peptidase [Microbacteriaceae bacterium]|nr:prepilin peptidase [Microbacteriaceae bacterium]
MSAPETVKTVALLVAGALTIFLAITDLREKRLPNKLVAALHLTWLIAGIMFTVLNPASISAFLASAVVWVGTALVAFALKIALPRHIGWGDVKLLPALTALLTWRCGTAAILTYAALAAAFLAVHAAVSLIVKKQKNSPAEIPAGPALIAGFWLAILLFPQLAQTS